MGAHHRFRAVAQAESARGGEGDPQDRVGKCPAADESLFGGIAVDHAVDLPEVDVAGTLATEFGLGRGGRLPHPVGGARMAREEAPPALPSPREPAIWRASSDSAPIVSRKLDIAIASKPLRLR